jgi:hypothetical protein
MNKKTDQRPSDSVWRIKRIPHEEAKAQGIVSFLPAIGGVGFIMAFSMLLLILISRMRILARFYHAALAFSAAGLFVLFMGLWLMARQKRRGWKIVYGRCVDREIKQVYSPNGEHSGWVWDLRIVCEYEFGGKTYRVTPKVGWSTYATEKEALKYLEKRISPTGGCKLGINPNTPLQAELLGSRGIKEMLLWKAYEPPTDEYAV